MPIAQETVFLGANTKTHRRFLPEGVGRASLNQKPSEEGDFRPWRVPLAISGPVIPSGRTTIYRLGQDTASSTDFWLSWTTIVHAIRGFDASDPTERTYFTGSGGPKWTDNIIGIASAPYPTATRYLAVPPPLVAPTVTLNTDGPSGDARQLYYVYTRVNDIGWESAPSPPFLAPAAKPGATLDLSYSESVPAGNYGVTKVRWYRQQVVADTRVAEYFFLREYAIGASGQLDDARALGDILATEDWQPLDSTATWLTYCWNQFAAAIVGKSVRFCVPDAIYAWPPLDYDYALNSTPIALAAFAQRLVAFTSAGAEIFTGSDPAELDQKPLRLAALVSQRSLVVGDSFCMWAAKDGLWYYGVDGSAGSSALWRAPLNSSWATDNQGFGATEFYVQFRKKNGLNSLTPSTNGGGFKIINLSEYKPTSPNSSRGHAGNEIVLNNQNWRGILFAYRELSPGGQIGFDEQIGADIYLQPAVDHGAGVSDPFARYCLYQSGDASAGCWFLQEEAWFTICMRVKIPSYGGSAGNEFDVWVARAGETSYTQLFNNRNFAIDYDPILTNGVNGAWFSAYDTNRTGASYDTYHEFDQLIVSTQPIACPVF